MEYLKNKKAVLIASGIVGISALAYYFNKPSIKFKREEIYAIMKDLKGQLFSVWVQVADIRNKVVAENNNSEIMNGKNIREILLQQTKELVSAKKKMICVKYEIQEDELDDYVDIIYKDDEMIQNIQESISKCFYDAIEGKKPDLNISQDVLDVLPQEKVLFLVEKILRQCGKKMVNVFVDLREKGETDFSIGNPQFVRQIKSLQLGKLKKEILTDNGCGFEGEPDSPTGILAKIVSKYKQENANFNEKITALENKYETMMDKLTVGADKEISPELCLETFGSEDQFNEQFEQYKQNLQQEKQDEQQQQEQQQQQQQQ